MEQTVIITAGGIGKRMGYDIPKQFIPINGRPILMHTIKKFYQFNEKIQIIVVLPKDQIAIWENLCQEYEFDLEHEVTAGGKERFHSVKSGLNLAKGDLIAVHDAVRPFVSISVINTCFESAKKDGAAIPVVPVTESLRQLVEDDVSLALDRSKFRLVQTPQCFKRSVLFSAYETPYKSQFTDDASVVEASNYKVQLIEGNPENIKITRPMDLKLAELFLNANE